MISDNLIAKFVMNKTKIEIWQTNCPGVLRFIFFRRGNLIKSEVTGYSYTYNQKNHIGSVVNLIKLIIFTIDSIIKQDIPCADKIWFLSMQRHFSLAVKYRKKELLIVSSGLFINKKCKNVPSV